jgi:hypothetical protein
MAGPYHIELVAGENQLTLYITDHADNPIQSAGGSAAGDRHDSQETLRAGARRVGDNKLEGTASSRSASPAASL